LEVINMSRPITTLDGHNLAELYQSGESTNSLAKRFGVSRSAIDRRLKQAGIALRTRSESEFVKNSRMTPDERRAQAAAANEALRGSRNSDETVCKRAIARERLLLTVSPAETYFMSLLTERGLTCSPQKACGKYNIDIAVAEGSISVDIFGGQWHSFGRHAARFGERNECLLNGGWLPIYIWVPSSYALEPAAADYVVSLADSARRGEADRGKYRMIYGNARPCAIGEAKRNQVS
jgi:hypothetical protein